MRNNTACMRIIYVVVLAAFFAACSNVNKYKICGKVDDTSYDGESVVLLKLSDGSSGLLPVDSTTVKDGSFTMNGSMDTAGWYVLMVNSAQGRPLYKDLYVEGNLDVECKAGRICVLGNRINEAYQVFSDEYDRLASGVLRMEAQLRHHPDDEALKKAYNEAYTRFLVSFRELAISGIRQNMDNPLGLHLFHVALSNLEDSDLDSILLNANSNFRSDPVVKMVSRQLVFSTKVGIGKPFVDLTMRRPDATPVSLSDYAGKGCYVLIDFWASWCAPCMRAIPGLKDCYEKFHRKGFEIVGVSLDKDAQAWNAAIKSQKISWPQMSDLAGWQSQAVSVYSFSSIPHTVLLDPRGVIIAKDLLNEDLKGKLVEFLGE